MYSTPVLFTNWRQQDSLALCSTGSGERERLVLLSVSLEWTYLLAGVPNGSSLKPLLFLLYINYIVNDIGANIRVFADDMSLFTIVKNPMTTAICLNSNLNVISQRAAT